MMDPSSSHPHPQRPVPPRLPSANTKTSLVSPSPSCEADDERSLSEASMEFSLPGSRGPPQYPGEDTRYTSKKELAGWYGYGWAAEVFVVCGIGEACRVLVLYFVQGLIRTVNDRLIHPNNPRTTSSRARSPSVRQGDTVQSEPWRRFRQWDLCVRSAISEGARA